jgi:hypothetical protein
MKSNSFEFVFSFLLLALTATSRTRTSPTKLDWGGSCSLARSFRYLRVAAHLLHQAIQHHLTLFTSHSEHSRNMTQDRQREECTSEASNAMRVPVQPQHIRRCHPPMLKRPQQCNRVGLVCIRSTPMQRRSEKRRDEAAHSRRTKG